MGCAATMLTFNNKAFNHLGYFRISEDKSHIILMDDARRNEDGQAEVDALPVVTPASSPVAQPTLAAWPYLYLKPTPEEEPEAGGHGNTAPSGTTAYSQGRTEGPEGPIEGPNKHAKTRTDAPKTRTSTPKSHKDTPKT